MALAAKKMRIDFEGLLSLSAKKARDRTCDKADSVGADEADDGHDGNRSREAGGHERRGVGNAHVDGVDAKVSEARPQNARCLTACATSERLNIFASLLISPLKFG